MSGEQDKLTIDARLLSDAIIELNIARRSISIYPKGHPSVQKSLDRAFSLFRKIFEIRDEITVAVAKDTLIVDEFYLDRKNPVYREFALYLSRRGIAFITFIRGLTKEQLYEFQKIITDKKADEEPDRLKIILSEKPFAYVNTGFIDYAAFSFEQGVVGQEKDKAPIWERYIYGVLTGALQAGEISEMIRDVTPEALGSYLNENVSEDTNEETYDEVITSYMKRSSETAISSQDMKKLRNLIDALKPELKKQFLASSVRIIAKDVESAKRLFSEISVDEAVKFLNSVNEQNLEIPAGLKNLLNKLVSLPQEAGERIMLGGEFVIDDIFLSGEARELLAEDHKKKFISESYENEVKKLLEYSAPAGVTPYMKDMDKECNDDYIEKYFSQILLDLLSSDFISDIEEYKTFLSVLKEQTDEFVSTGQFSQIYQALVLIENNVEKKRFPDITDQAAGYFYSEVFVKKLIDSFRIFGRQAREEVWFLCEHYGKRIIPFLMDALAQEESQTNRKFFLNLLKLFGNRLIPEISRRLGDSRWFVKRNMLYLLADLKKPEILTQVRPYAHYHNRKVCFEALRCLLNAGDEYGVRTLKDYLKSDEPEDIEMAAALSGAYRVREIIPDLLQFLKKKSLSGSDLYEKISIIKALGEIGDSGALGTLKEILSAKKILFKNAAEKLNEEIFRSLRNYPYKDIKDIVSTGLKSKNEFIKAEARRLSQRGQG